MCGLLSIAAPRQILMHYIKDVFKSVMILAVQTQTMVRVC